MSEKIEAPCVSVCVVSLVSEQDIFDWQRNSQRLFDTVDASVHTLERHETYELGVSTFLTLDYLSR